MNDPILQKAKAVAIEAARQAGAIAKERFDRSYTASEKGEHGDIVTEVDLLAEAVILKQIGLRFPVTGSSVRRLEKIAPP